jgi:hypothetical protein
MDLEVVMDAVTNINEGITAQCFDQAVDKYIPEVTFVYTGDDVSVYYLGFKIWNMDEDIDIDEFDLEDRLRCRVNAVNSGLSQLMM